jgi:ABC-type branched-subunit amino acid transport system ATPase component
LGDSYTEEALGGDTRRILDSLHLHDVADRFAVDITPGQRRMLSLAEELTEDPYLLLIDEPVRSLSARETAVVMGCLRELVNQDRTVIASIYEVGAPHFLYWVLSISWFYLCDIHV